MTVFQLAITLGILVALLSNAALFDAAARLGAGPGGLGERLLAEETSPGRVVITPEKVERAVARLAEELFGQVQPAGLSLAVVVGSTGLFLVAAAWVFSHREYVLDQ